MWVQEGAGVDRERGESLFRSVLKIGRCSEYPELLSTGPVSECAWRGRERLITMSRGHGVWMEQEEMRVGQ